MVAKNRFYLNFKEYHIVVYVSVDYLSFQTYNLNIESDR
jgi:hypothetical protein